MSQVKIQSFNGKTKMLDKVAGMLVTQLLWDIKKGISSKGLISFDNFDYEVRIMKVRKRRWANLFGLLRRTK